MKVIIECSEKQALLIKSSLDLLSRLHLGQIEEIKSILIKIAENNNVFWDGKKEITLGEKNSYIENIVKIIKSAIGFKYGESFGIYNACVDDAARTAFWIIQNIRYQLAWFHNPVGNITVDYDTPKDLSGKEENINVCIKKDDGEIVYKDFDDV